MKRKLLSVLLVFGMLITAFAFLPNSDIVSMTCVNAHAETNTNEYENLKYTVLDDGTVAITGLVSRTETVEIPSQIDGKKVTVIKNSAFAALQPNKVTTKVTLPDTLTTIEPYAFMNMQAITSITIPASVKTIDNYAFQICSGLQTVTFKGNPTTLGSGVFSGCTSLKKVDIPSGVTSICGSLFFNCTNLTAVTIPASVTSIDSTAFKGCTALQSITVASGNSNYSSEDGVLYNITKTKIICCPKAKTSLTIPGTIKEIDQEFMYNSSSLTTLVFQDGVTTIGPNAFAFCKKLTSVTLPTTLTKIGDYAFNTCTSLSEITVPASVTSVGSKALGFYRKTVDGSELKQSGFTIYGYTGSKTESWAKTNGIAFVSLGAACEHKWGSWVVTKQPTCTAAGEETRACSKCSVTEKQPVAATGHDYGDPTYKWNKTSSGYTCTATAVCKSNSSHTVKKTATATVTSSTAVTCTTDGVTVYTAVIELNGKTYTATNTVTVEAKGHSFGGASWVWDGYTKATANFTCSKCKTVEPVKAKITSETTQPTCTVAGKTIYTATAQFNGKTYTASKTQNLSPLGHDFGAPDHWEWTDYKAKAYFICSACKTEKIITASMSSTTTVQPTCTATGKKVHTAKVTLNSVAYTDNKTETLPAKGHTFGSPTWTWDGYTKAKASFTCSACKTAETVNAKITSETTTTATCTKTGMIKHTATVIYNGKTYTTYVNETVPKLNHKYSVPTWTWSKTSNGYTCKAKFTCTECSTSSTLTATVTVTSTSADCTVAGKKVYTAKVTVNGREYTETKTDTEAAIGHTYGEPTWTWSSDFSTATAKFTCSNGDSTKTVNATVTSSAIAASCTYEGKTEYKATVTFNGKTYTNTQTVVLEAKGHNYSQPKWTWEGFSSAKAECSCSWCTSKLSVLAMIRVTRTEPTCTTAGSSVYTATATLNGNSYTDTKTEVLKATGHSYGEAVWSWTGTSAATAKFTCEKGDSTVSLSATITTKTTDPTCTATGKKVFTATVTFNGQTYKDTKSETIPKSEHSWGDWKITTQPTETETGVKTRVCNACGATMTETVPVTDHTHKYTESVYLWV